LKKYVSYTYGIQPNAKEEIMADRTLNSLKGDPKYFGTFKTPTATIIETKKGWCPGKEIGGADRKSPSGKLPGDRDGK